MRLTSFALALLLASHALGAPRSPAVRAEFQRLNPCPATGERRGACPGFDVEHTEPLCLYGRDELPNLTWMEREAHKVKTRADLTACREMRRWDGPRP